MRSLVFSRKATISADMLITLNALSILSKNVNFLLINTGFFILKPL